MRGRWAIEAVTEDIAIDQVTAEPKAHFLGAGAGCADKAGTARLKRLDRTDADTLQKAQALDLALRQRNVHRAAHLNPGPLGQRRIGAATSAYPSGLAVATVSGRPPSAALSVFRKVIAGSRPPIVEKAS